MEGTGLYSSSDLRVVRAEFTRWNRVLPLVAGEIRRLPADQARQVIGVLENSGALGVLEELGRVEIGAPKVAAGEYDEHHLLVRLDAYSFMLGNVTALLKVGGVALLFTGAGPPGAAIVGKIAAVLHLFSPGPASPERCDPLPLRAGRLCCV